MIWKNVFASGNNNLQNSLAEKSVMTIEDSFFTGALYYNFIYSKQSGTKILLKNCTFKQLSTSFGINTQQGATLSIQDCIFDQIISRDSKVFTFISDAKTNGLSVIKNSSFTNIEVQNFLIHLEGRGVCLSVMNVTFENITQQKNLAVINGLFSDQELILPRGICCMAIKNAQIFVESSKFSNIHSNCFGIRDSPLTLKSTTFDNSEI